MFNILGFLGLRADGAHGACGAARAAAALGRSEGSSAERLSCGEHGVEDVSVGTTSACGMIDGASRVWIFFRATKKHFLCEFF